MLLNIETSPRFVKFLLTGAFGAGCYFLTSYALSANGIEAWLASLIAYTGMVPVVYFIQKVFVFESDRSHSTSFPRYVAIQIIGLSLSASLPFLLGRLGISPAVSFLCVVALITLINYALQARWAFSQDT